MSQWTCLPCISQSSLQKKGGIMWFPAQEGTLRDGLAVLAMASAAPSSAHGTSTCFLPHLSEVCNLRANSFLGRARWTMGFPGGSAGKESACNAGDLGSIPGSGRSPGEVNGHLLQYSYPENSADRAAWWAAVLAQKVGHDWVTNTHTHTHAWTTRSQLLLLKNEYTDQGMEAKRNSKPFSPFRVICQQVLIKSGGQRTTKLSQETTVLQEPRLSSTDQTIQNLNQTLLVNLLLPQHNIAQLCRLNTEQPREHHLKHYR